MINKQMINLNPYQEEAASHKDGPCLVTSVPGSGKTAMLVERTARLINSGVVPKSIVCMTFTNKAADEMKERISKRLGLKRPGLWVGTFHSLCALLLRKFGINIGLSERFTILDSNDQKDLMLKCSRQLGFDLEKNEILNIVRAVNNYRENMQTHEHMEVSLNNREDFIRLADDYIDRLRRSDCVDFSGLLSESIRLLKESKPTLDKIQDAFKYLQVDEFQDTNKAQFELLNLFSGKWNNILGVGDLSQCVIKGTSICTPNGNKNVEDLQVGDYVSAASGRSGIQNAKISNIYKKKVTTKLIKVTTEWGHVLETTPEHVYFAGFTSKTSAKFFVYLMYKGSFGYRIGISRAFNSKANHGRMGFINRCSGEVADKVWILQVADTEVESRYFEHLYSVTYGIPTWTFKQHSFKENAYNQEYINKLFKNIDTIGNVEKLFIDFGLDREYPHHTPIAISKHRRRNFSVTLCGDSRHMPLHNYAISGSDESDALLLKSTGLNVRKAKTCKGWRIESSTSDLADIKDKYNKVKSVMDINLIEQARFSNRSLPFMPASNLHVGMNVFCYNNGKIIEDEIVKIEKNVKSCEVYDLDIQRYHNFIGNNIVTHNSIYRFRGARYQNIHDFIARHDNCKVLELSLNYRSTPEIISIADKLIRHNKSHMSKEFRTDNDSGNHPVCVRLQDQMEEAEWVSKHIHRLVNEGGWAYSDIAILYRMNSMAEPIERSLTNNKMEYIVIGGRSFYDRREVKDCLSILKFLMNPKDSIAFERMSSFIAGLGNVTIGKVENIADENSIAIMDAFDRYLKVSNSQQLKTAYDLIKDSFDIGDINRHNAATALDEVLTKLKYFNFLEKEYKEDFQDRIDNVRSMVVAAGEFSDGDNGYTAIQNYLQMVSLITSSDKKKDGNRISLMTLHASKGQEFPIVFIVGIEHGILPHGMSLSEDIETKTTEGIEEERRLFYVGVTRAEKALFTSYCKRRKFFSKGGSNYKAARPSQFLFESGLVKKNEKEGIIYGEGSSYTGI